MPKRTCRRFFPHRAVTAAEAREMLMPVLEALAYLHGKGFVHGHIKPANIMAVEDQLRSPATGSSRMDESRGCLGKPGVYDAPEMRAEGISPAADVWSLGMTLVEALTQRLPFGRDGTRGTGSAETCAAPFLELARHCLRRDPQRRWTVADVLNHMGRPRQRSRVPTTAIQQPHSRSGPLSCGGRRTRPGVGGRAGGPQTIRHPEAPEPLPSG